MQLIQGKKIGIMAICIAGTLFPCASTMAQESPMLVIDSGALQGVVDDGVAAFKGIPYAAAPVGQLRWKAPQPAPAWKGVRQADQYGHDCMQEPFPSDAAPLGSQPAEDCLVLNVWKPAHSATKKLPVMVWIYGGGFVNGGSSPAVYDGSQFAKQDVILVSFNYRVGRFGFFAHPALTKENPDGVLGNYGFMDQIAALQWVQRNIGAFGGDADNVTLFGESAGGFSVHTMLTSPLAKGLFHKAIIQSGGGRTSIGGGRYLQSPSSSGLPSAEDVGMSFAAKNQISGTDEKALAALRALPAETVTDGLNMMTMNDPTYSGPFIDGKLVTAEPQDIYRAGDGMSMPLLVGATDMDIGFPPLVKNMQEALAPLGKSQYQKAVQAYNPDGTYSAQDVAQMVASDQMMVEPGRFAARMAVAQGQPVYAYRFAYVADSMKTEWQGAQHATEIPYVFNTVQARYADALTANDKAMAAQVQQYWVNFAKTGNPNAEGLPDWPVYDTKSDQILLFSANGAPATAAVADPWKARLDLIENLFK